MRSLILISSLILLNLCSSSLYARARAYGECARGNQVALVTGGIYTSTTTPLLRSFPSCTVTVYDTGTLNLATIYSDNSSTPLANPFTANSFGYWFFYANNGRYDVRLSGGGIASPFTLSDIILTDPANFAASVSSFNGRTGAVVPVSGDYTFSLITGNITIHTHADNTQGGQIGLSAFAAGIKNGNGTKLQLTNGSLTANRCLEADANGNIVTAASNAACGTGTSPVTSVFGRTGVVVATNNDYAFTQISGTNAVNKGGTGATTLTGILQGNGTSAFTANAAANELTYLRRAPNLSSVTYEFASPTFYSSADYNFPAQSPGGSLSVGANSITLTPCPLGVDGAGTNDYYYISGGVGTAETVLATGGTCTSGLSTGTLIFTAANTHSGAWTIESASAGIKQAINVCNGDCLIQLPGDVLTISGPNGLVIDKSNITLMGSGIGSILRSRASGNDSATVTIGAAGGGARLLNLAVDGNLSNGGTDAATGASVRVQGTTTGILISGGVIEDAVRGIWLEDNGGVVSGVLVTNNRINATTGILADAATTTSTVIGNNFTGSTTPITDNSTYGLIVSGNTPFDSNLTVAGSVASAATLTLRCGQVAVVTGAVGVETINVQTDADLGCSVTLIPDPASTWVTSNTGNIAVTSMPIPGVALTLFWNGTSWYPSY